MIHSPFATSILSFYLVYFNRSLNSILFLFLCSKSNREIFNYTFPNKSSNKLSFVAVIREKILQIHEKSHAKCCGLFYLVCLWRWTSSTSCSIKTFRINNFEQAFLLPPAAKTFSLHFNCISTIYVVIALLLLPVDELKCANLSQFDLTKISSGIKPSLKLMCY